MSAEKPRRRKPAAKKATKPTPEKKRRGEKAAKIEKVLADLATHGNTSRACRTAGIDRPDFLAMVRENDEIGHRYARAKLDGIHAAAEEMLAIADNADEDPASRRVRVDTRKWLFARLAPKHYGDRIETHHTADDGLKAALADRLTKARAAEIRDIDGADHT